MARFGTLVEPPVGVEGNQSQPSAHIHYRWSRASSFGEERGAWSASVADVAPLPPDGRSAAGTVPGPVMITWDEDCANARGARYLELREEPTLSLGTFR